MAPRRKRNVLDDSDSEEEKVHHDRTNSLKNYLFPSPDSKRKDTAATTATTATASTSAITTPVGSPNPVRKSTAFFASPTKSSPAATSPFGRILSTRIKNSSPGKSPCSSPEKKRRTAKLLPEEKGKSGDLVALFSKQAEKAQNSPKPNKTRTVDFVLDDIASDPISDDDDIAESNAVPSSYVGLRAQKRWRNTQLPSSGATQTPSGSGVFASSAPAASTSASQKFRRPVRATSGAAVPDADDDLRPWSERFAPVNLDELAVHKKKVADVRRWIEDVLTGRLRQRLLVLKGAAGTGKTTTVQLLAKDLGLAVLEWRNPSGSIAGSYTSAAAQFDEFLNRSSRFSQLDLEGGSSDSDEGAPAPTTTLRNSAGDERRRKIVLIEEFPNTFMRSSSGLTNFRSAVLQFLSANTPSLAAFAQRQAPTDISPVIMVVSETLLTTTSASADSFTAHRLLGPEILRHPGTGVIEFNNIAPSLLAKALELVVQKEARKSGRRRTPGPQVLRRLGEVGDVRSAVASLEFLCVKGDDDGDWGAKVAFTKGRRGPKDAALTKGERETLEMVSQREASLGLFHAIGKVVYNKREDAPYPPGSDEAAAETLPDFLAHTARPKKPLVAVDTLIDETGTDTHTFLSALHENYVLSCEQTGPRDQNSSLDYVNGCIEYLSESDLLCPTWDIFFGGRGTSRFHGGRDSGSHVLRQDEMAFQVAVRGLLFSLPSPVKRSTGGSYQRGAGGGGGGSGASLGGGDQFKMFYPMSLKLWRSREELEGLVDSWSSKLLRGEVTQQLYPTQPTQNLTSRALAFIKPKSNGTGSSQASGVAPSQYASQPSGDKAGDKKAAKQGEKDSTASPLLSLGSSARKEMILERLPYMALIARGRRCSFGSMGMRDLEKMVSFHGIGAPATSAEDDDEDEADGPGATSGMGSFSADDAWATDKPTDDPSPRKKRRPEPTQRRRVVEEDEPDVLSAGLPMYKLYLSDDDIEEVD